MDYRSRLYNKPRCVNRDWLRAEKTLGRSQNTLPSFKQSPTRWDSRSRVSKSRQWSSRRSVLEEKDPLRCSSTQNRNSDPIIEVARNPDLSWHGIDLSHSYHMLKTCWHTHTRCAKTYLNAPGSHNDEILLLDVHDLCLVQNRLSCSYLTLSYVWGGTAQFETTRENFIDLQRPGAIAEHFDLIPQVIKDGIEVTRLLGERFLWVDRLSIIQDDSQSKHDHIQRMGRIYHGCLLTIVALGGNKASDSLNCSSEQSRPFVDQENISSIPAYTTSLQMRVLGSAHNERAWTFQERLLSPRCLFFHGKEQSPFFVCRQDFAYDMPGKLHNGDKTIDRVVVHKAHVLNPLASYFDSSRMITDEKQRRFEAFSRYDQLVSGYTSRKLSFSSDILNAFVGILEILAYNRSWDYIMGLPVPVLSLALLWTPSKFTRRRSARSFPSWSWVGWEGHVDYRPLRAYDLAQDLRSTIRSFTYYDGNLDTIRRIHCAVQPHTRQHLNPSPTMLGKRTVDECCITKTQLLQSIQRQSLKDILIFSTKCVSVSAFSYINGPTYTQDNLISCPNDRPVLQIMTSNRHYCGLLYGINLQGDYFVMDECFVPPSECSFVLMSDLYGMRVYEDEQSSTGGIDEAYFPHGPCNSGSDMFKLLHAKLILALLSSTGLLWRSRKAKSKHPIDTKQSSAKIHIRRDDGTTAEVHTIDQTPIEFSTNCVVRWLLIQAFRTKAVMHELIPSLVSDMRGRKDEPSPEQRCLQWKTPEAPVPRQEKKGNTRGLEMSKPAGTDRVLGAFRKAAQANDMDPKLFVTRDIRRGAALGEAYAEEPREGVSTEAAARLLDHSGNSGDMTRKYCIGGSRKDTFNSRLKRKRVIDEFGWRRSRSRPRRRWQMGLLTQL
ncbi:HET-domain-containing protein [Rhizodiscina lignyota]|uniref:HET-domain-containing protein n=1 Tax=Rhizodiscina lignyota TaxID=1504668 RepID=A0A9P4M5S3_9PEZI|nr:HET-domain-containing protein [Rhizodiscina lignyota]